MEFIENMSNIYVVVQGVVIEFFNVSFGYFLMVDIGVVFVIVFILRVFFIKNNVFVKVGDMVYVFGIVYFYKGIFFEIVVRLFEQFNVMLIESVLFVLLVEVFGYVGMVMLVQGSFMGIIYESGCYVFMFIDGINYFEVFVLREVFVNFNLFELVSGSLIKVVGKMGDDGRFVGVYLGVIEVVKMEFFLIGVLIFDMKGMIVVVKVNIEDVQNVGLNFKFVVSDGMGKIDVFILLVVFREFFNEILVDFKEGFGVEVVGYFDEYCGSLEVVVYMGSGIKVLGRLVGFLEVEFLKVKVLEFGKYIGKFVDFVGFFQGFIYVNGIYYLNVDSVIVFILRDVLMVFNLFDVGEGSVFVIRGFVKDLNNFKGEFLIVQVVVLLVQIKFEDVILDMVGKVVVVVGRVMDVVNFSGNFKIIFGSFLVFVLRIIVNELVYVLQEGDLVEIGGYVEFYCDEFEIVVFYLEVIRKIGVSGLVEGMVFDFKSVIELFFLMVIWDFFFYESGEYYFGIYDDMGSMIVMVIKDFLLNLFEVVIGSIFKFVVDLFFGSVIFLEIVKVVLLKFYQIGEVMFDMKGKVIVFNVIVVKVVVVGDNFKFIFDDGSGGIVVFILNGVELSVDEGLVVYMVGYVEEYNGVLEFVVYIIEVVKVEGVLL